MQSWTGWAFGPGPVDAARVPSSTVVLRDIAPYSPDEVAAAFVSRAGFQILHPPAPSWWEWVAEWREAGRYLTVNMTLFETDPPTWGGSEIVRAACEPDDVLAVWFAIRERLPGAWLQHYDTLYTPELFEREFGRTKRGTNRNGA